MCVLRARSLRMRKNTTVAKETTVTSVGCWCTTLCGNPWLTCRGGILIVVDATCFTFNGIVFNTRVFGWRCCCCCCCWDNGAGAMLRIWGLTRDCAAILIVLAVVLPWEVDCRTVRQQINTTSYDYYNEYKYESDARNNRAPPHRFS